MNRITRAHIDAELIKLERVADRAGLKDRADKWVLTRGSVQHKEPWRLSVRKGRNGLVWVEFLPEGAVGLNATEVMLTIKTLRRAWEHVYKVWGDRGIV